MTPEQKAAAFSKSIKCIDWTKGDPIAEFWLAGYRETADSYIESAVFQGMEEKINHLLEVIRILKEEGKRDAAFIKGLLEGIEARDKDISGSVKITKWEVSEE